MSFFKYFSISDAEPHSTPESQKRSSIENYASYVKMHIPTSFEEGDTGPITKLKKKLKENHELYLGQLQAFKRNEVDLRHLSKKKDKVKT